MCLNGSCGTVRLFPLNIWFFTFRERNVMNLIANQPERPINAFSNKKSHRESPREFWSGLFSSGQRRALFDFCLLAKHTVAIFCYSLWSSSLLECYWFVFIDFIPSFDKTSLNFKRGLPTIFKFYRKRKITTRLPKIVLFTSMLVAVVLVDNLGILIQKSLIYTVSKNWNFRCVRSAPSVGILSTNLSSINLLAKACLYVLSYL